MCQAQREEGPFTKLPDQVRPSPFLHCAPMLPLVGVRNWLATGNGGFMGLEEKQNRESSQTITCVHATFCCSFPALVQKGERFKAKSHLELVFSIADLRLCWQLKDFHCLKSSKNFIAPEEFSPSSRGKASLVNSVKKQ